MKIKPELPMLAPPKEGASETRNPKLLQAARMYEKQFLREMVAAMRKTVENGGMLEEGMGEQIFREKLDDEYVETWGDRGGIGIADVIYRQVSERYGIGASKGLKPHLRGPLPVSNTAVQSIVPSGTGPHSSLQLRVQLDPKTPNSNRSEIQAPWAGRILAKGPLSDGRSFVRVEHETGWVSDFSFRGQILDQPIGSSLQPQQTIGYLSSGSLDFDWGLKPASLPASR